MAGRDSDDIDKGSRSAAPVLTLDCKLYDQYLEDSDWSEEQKREFLEAMWSVIVEFVMLGFEIHPAQQAKRACGKPQKTATSRPNIEADAVSLEHRTTRKDFDEAAGAECVQAAERIQE